MGQSLHIITKTHLKWPKSVKSRRARMKIYQNGRNAIKTTKTPDKWSQRPESTLRISSVNEVNPRKTIQEPQSRVKCSENRVFKTKMSRVVKV